MVTEAVEARVISTGNTEIDKKLGGGIPVGSLVLMEGQSDAGKSVVSQHFTYGGLKARMGIAYYTTENTVKSLMSQMSSLDMDVMDYVPAYRSPAGTGCGMGFAKWTLG